MRIVKKIEKYYMKHYREIEKTINITTIIGLYYSLQFVNALIIVFLLDETDVYLKVIINTLELLIILCYYLYKKKDINPKRRWTKRKMNIKAFVFIVSLMILKGKISTTIVTIINTIKGTQNAVIPGTVADIGTNIDTIILAVIIAPIIEEIMMRGAGLSLFTKKDNKIEAIIFTSVLFGLMHGNYPQAINATMGGLIYGYVAIEFGIVYSIIFHSINNGMAYLGYFCNIEKYIDIISVIIIFICLYNRERIIEKLKINLKSKKEFSIKRQVAYFTSPIVLVYCILWTCLILIPI